MPKAATTAYLLSNLPILGALKSLPLVLEFRQAMLFSQSGSKSTQHLHPSIHDEYHRRTSREVAREQV